MTHGSKQVGIYGGTFDPIHFGHLNLALELLERQRLDEIWFCPANLPPFKQGIPLSSPQHRAAMVALAIADIPAFRLLDIELQREGPSYTIDTVRELMQKDTKIGYHLILGDDSIENFSKWHQAEQLVDLIPLSIGRRTCQPPEIRSASAKISTALRRGLLPTRVLEISGTDIRKRLHQGLYCGHLLPEKVAA